MKRNNRLCQNRKYSAGRMRYDPSDESYGQSRSSSSLSSTISQFSPYDEQAHRDVSAAQSLANFWVNRVVSPLTVVRNNAVRLPPIIRASNIHDLKSVAGEKADALQETEVSPYRTQSSLGLADFSCIQRYLVNQGKQAHELKLERVMDELILTQSMNNRTS